MVLAALAVFVCLLCTVESEPVFILADPTTRILEQEGQLTIAINVEPVHATNSPFRVRATSSHITTTNVEVDLIQNELFTGTGTRVDIPITLHDNNLPEPPKTFRLVLTPDAGLEFNPSEEFIITIYDDDAFRLASPPAIFDEQDATVNIPILVHPDAFVGSPFRIQEIFRHVTTDNTRLDPSSSFITGNGVNVDIPIVLRDNMLYEGDAQFIVRLQSSAAMLVGLEAEFEVTVREDDPLLDVPTKIVVWEDAGQVNITIGYLDGMARADPQQVIVYTVTVPPSADINPATEDDFTPKAGVTSMIQANAASTVVSIDLVNDMENEYLEMFEVKILGTLPENQTVKIFIQDDDTPRPYHCRRTGQDCIQGTCNVDSGFCDCPLEYSAAQTWNCGVSNASIVSNEVCDVPCTATHNNSVTDVVEYNGVCVNAWPHKCQCRPGWTGAACDQNAYTATCGADSANVCIKPFGDFQGFIFIAGLPDCPVPLSNTAACDGYYAEIPFIPTDPTDNCKTTLTPGNGTNQHVVQLVIQYNPLLDDGLSEAVQVTCNQTVSGEVSVSSHLGASGSQPRLEPVKITRESAVGTIVVRDEGNNVVTADSVVSPGTRLTFCITVRPELYEGIVIKSIKLNNTLDETDANYRDVDTYVDGCDQGTGLLIEPPANTAADMNEVCFTLLAAQLQHSTSLGIQPIAIVYAPGDTVVPVTCTSVRKRQAAGEEAEIGVVIKYDIGITQDIPKESTVEEGNWQMTVAIVAGLVGLTILIVIVAVAIVMLRNRTQKQQPEL